MKLDVAAALALALPSVAWAGEPIARYAFDGDLTDSRGGPAAIATGVTPAADRGDRAARAYSFAGAGQIIVDNPKLPAGRSPRTMTAWFRTSSATAVEVVANYGTPTQGQRFGILLDHAHVKFVGESADLVSARTFADGLWHHAAVAYDPAAKVATTTLYVDGVREAEGRLALDTKYQPMVIGNAVSGHRAEWFTGSIDDVRVYDYAMAPSEIAASGRDATSYGGFDGDDAERAGWVGLLTLGGGLISLFLARGLSARSRACPRVDVHHRALHTVLFDHPDGLTLADIADELRLSIGEAEELIDREQRKLLIDVVGYEAGEIRYVTLRRVRPSQSGDAGRSARHGSR
jgi:Concanavalin A-like lectin/glucanases superfamily